MALNRIGQWVGTAKLIAAQTANKCIQQDIIYGNAAEPGKGTRRQGLDGELH